MIGDFFDAVEQFCEQEGVAFEFEAEELELEIEDNDDTQIAD